jgi:MFS family permease
VVMCLVPVPYALALVWLANTTTAVTTTFAFFFLRWCMGTAMLTAFNATNQWWVRRKGMASAVVNVIGAFNITFVTVLTAILARVGWRQTILIEAAMIGVVYTVLAVLTLHRPETYGRLPDGMRSPGMPDDARTSPDADGAHAVGVEGTTAGENDGKSADHDADDEDEDAERARAMGQSGEDAVELLPTASGRRRHDRPTSSRSGSTGADGGDQRGADGEAGARESAMAPGNDAADSHGPLGRPGTGPAATVAGVPAADALSGVQELHWHWRDAVRTKAFWAVTLSSCMVSLLWSGFNFHATSILTEMGLDEAAVAYMYLPIALGSAAGMLVAGALVDRIRVKSRSAAMATAAGALCVGLLFASGSLAPAVLFSLVFGFMDGVTAIGNTSVFAYLFGRVHLGRIDALVNGLSTVFLGLGPTLFGVVRDTSGSYLPILVACAAPLVLLTGALFLTPAPKPPRSNRYLSLHDETG